MTKSHIALDQITPDAPITLETAIALKFKGCNVSVSSLRKEISKGRLVAWRFAGKDLTSLTEIDRMLELCRVKPKAPDSGSESPAPPQGSMQRRKASGLSAMEGNKQAQDAAKATVKALRERLRNTLPQNTKSRVANVVSLTPRSQTC